MSAVSGETGLSDDLGPGLLARICTQIERLGDRLDADTLTLWRAAVADRNVTSPPAMGCLHAMVREAWGDPGLLVIYDERWWILFGDTARGREVMDPEPSDDQLSLDATSEFEALVAALEEAPVNRREQRGGEAVDPA